MLGKIPNSALASLTVAVVLWSAGLLTTPHPAILSLGLLAVAGLGWRGVRMSLGGIYTGSAPTRPRRRHAFAATGASLLLSLHFLLGIFQPGSSIQQIESAALARSPEVANLRVLSLNVRHGYPGFGRREARYRRLEEMLAASRADVVLLQEAWSSRRFGHLTERLAAGLGFHAVYTRANGSLRFLGFEEGLAIMSRYPLTAVEKSHLAPRLPPWEMRIAMAATVELPDGRSLRVVNTHLSHSSSRVAAAQARSLTTLLRSSSPEVVGGDFNDGPKSGALLALEDAGYQALVSDARDHLLASPALFEAWSPGTADTFQGAGVSANADLLSDHPVLLVSLHALPPSPRKATLVKPLVNATGATS